MSILFFFLSCSFVTSEYCPFINRVQILSVTNLKNSCIEEEWNAVGPTPLKIRTIWKIKTTWLVTFKWTLAIFHFNRALWKSAVGPIYKKSKLCKINILNHIWAPTKSHSYRKGPYPNFNLFLFQFYGFIIFFFNFSILYFLKRNWLELEWNTRTYFHYIPKLKSNRIDSHAKYWKINTKSDGSSSTINAAITLKNK